MALLDAAYALEEIAAGRTPARAIAGALATRVTQAEQRLVFASPTESLEAYDYVLRAKPALPRPARANNVEARALLRRAIQLDPNYAAAYAALAETYHIAVAMGWEESPAEFLCRAPDKPGHHGDEKNCLPPTIYPVAYGDKPGHDTWVNGTAGTLIWRP